MKTIFSLCCFLIILAGTNSCITIKRNLKTDDDGTTSLTKEDSTKIFPFDYATVHKTFDYASPSAIVFQKIDAPILRKIISDRKYSFVMIIASWCPVCEKSLKRNTRLMKKFSEDSIQFIIVSQNLIIKSLQQELFEADYNHLPYLMCSPKYGTNEAYKEERFIRDLDKRIPVKYFKDGPVPTNLIFNQKGELLFLANGVTLTCDSIKKYTGLGCKEL
jgi:thiol-disulfide isomerase/thioredoxin